MPCRVQRQYDPKLEMYERLANSKVEAEYRDDVLSHMTHLDQLTRADANMMDLQPEIEWHMRPYLLDFLIESHHSFGLSSKTLFLSINLIDRYCSRRVVFKKHYQLVGCAALWIAAKYEEKKQKIPTVKELRVMCCNAYDEDMFVQMEGHVLNTLEWQIGHPTVNCFLESLLSTSRQKPDVFVQHLSNYLSEMSLYHRSFVAMSASVIAASALALAVHILYCTPSVSGTQDEVQCMMMLSRYMQSPTRCLQKKYSSNRYSQVALFLNTFIARQQQLRQKPDLCQGLGNNSINDNNNNNTSHMSSGGVSSSFGNYGQPTPPLYMSSVGPATPLASPGAGVGLANVYGSPMNAFPPSPALSCASSTDGTSISNDLRQTNSNISSTGMSSSTGNGHVTVELFCCGGGAAKSMTINTVKAQQQAARNGSDYFSPPLTPDEHGFLMKNSNAAISVNAVNTNY